MPGILPSPLEGIGYPDLVTILDLLGGEHAVSLLPIRWGMIAEVQI